ncbi:MAG: DUF885 domain-containing protein, partial [Enterobacterales bacterium]|nr:DUF885 domain-containing protein [Enterobacterales bacterium]
ACSDEPSNSPEKISEETKITTQNQLEAQDAGDEAAKLQQLFTDFDEQYLALNPMFATFRGDNRFNDQLGDSLSENYNQQMHELDVNFLAQAKKINNDLLTMSDKTSLRVFKYQREIAIEAYTNKFTQKASLLPINQMFSLPVFLQSMGSGRSVQPFKTVEDYDNWLSRASEFQQWAEQAIINMNQGIEQGIVQPKLIMEKVLPQIKSALVDNAENSIFYTPIKNMPESFSEEEQERLSAQYQELITQSLIPAYSKLASYIETTYLPNTRETIGLSSLPDGKRWYEYQAKAFTTTDMTAQEIHDIGKAEAQRIFAEMNTVKNQVGFDGDIQAFFEFLRNDPQFYYNNSDDLIKEYDNIRVRVNAALPELFNIMPKADYEVRPIPEYQERSAPAAFYMPATPDGSRPGVFYANTYDLKARPKYTIEALSIHEANPGHHFQTSIASEQENLPNFRRFGGETAYVEGWGLYTESLGKALGVYTDPYQYFGALTFNIWRANRLVVDTGMHYLGWTREQAIEWMRSNAPLSETDIISEVDRYIAMPGQALAYKIGELKIHELKAKAEMALGEKFDIREFHSQILVNGAVPLSVLEDNIDDWIASLK